VATAHRFERSQLVPRPLPEVFAFCADPGNLEAMTLPTLFKIRTPGSIPLRAGTLIDYRVRLDNWSVCNVFGPLGIFVFGTHWQTRIETFEPEVRFSSVQLRGPFRRWHHLHEFFATSTGTLMVDTVDYELPLGPLGYLYHPLVRYLLAAIFDYRQAYLSRRFGTSHGAERRSA
jgi:ligand-binding SRPBCC domain-containing protein